MPKCDALGIILLHTLVSPRAYFRRLFAFSASLALAVLSFSNTRILALGKSRSYHFVPHHILPATIGVSAPMNRIFFSTIILGRTHPPDLSRQYLIDRSIIDHFLASIRPDPPSSNSCPWNTLFTPYGPRAAPRRPKNYIGGLRFDVAVVIAKPLAMIVINHLP